MTSHSRHSSTCRVAWALAAVLACTGAAWAQQADNSLPPELQALTPLLSDENKLAEMVRQYDLHQIALAEWDMSLAEEHAAVGENDLAQEKAQSAQKRFQLVRQAYEEVLKRYPENASAKTYYAELIYDHVTQPGDQEKAVRLWEEAVKTDPKFSDAWNNLAIHYSHSGSYKECFDAMDKALEVKPNNADYLFNAVQFYLIHTPQVEKHYGWSTEQTFNKALDYSRRAAELRPDSYPLWQDYASNFYRGDQLNVPVAWKEAAKAWQSARKLARNPNDEFFTWLNEGRCWLRDGNEGKAAPCFEEALRINPQSEAAKKLLEQAGKR